jgi:hypothetical protein
MARMPAARRGGATALLMGAAAGCGLGAQPAPALTGLAPAAGYSDAPLPVAIAGSGFRPTYEIDARTAAATVDVTGFRATLAPSDASAAPVELEDVVWQSPGLLAGRLPAGAPAGWYDLTVRDPRGVACSLPRAFQALGPDTTPPLVRIVSPSDQVFAVGAPVPVVATANDGQGVIAAFTATMTSGSGASRSYDCAVTGESMVSCAFTLAAPGAANTPDMLTIDVVATDERGQTGEARAQFGLVLAPTFDSLSPAAGSTLGSTVVRIEGGGLMSGPADVRFDGLPATVQSWGAHYLDVVTPPHPLAMTVPVTVTIAGVTVRKDAGFTYVAPPLVRRIVPTTGPAEGGFPVTVLGDNFAPGTTGILFGTEPLRCPRYQNANRIDGLAPPGSGIVAVSADDTVSGNVPHATIPFPYLDDDGGAAPPDGGVADGGATATTDAGCPVTP